MPSLNLNKASFRTDFWNSLNVESEEFTQGFAQNVSIPHNPGSSGVCGLSQCERQCLSVLDATNAPVTVKDVLRYAREAFALHTYLRTAEYNCREVGLSAAEDRCQNAHKYIWKALRLCYENCIGGEHCEIPRTLIQEVLFCDEDLGAIFGFLDKSPSSDCPVDILCPNAEENNTRSLQALEYYIGHVDMREFRSSICDPGDTATLRNTGCFLNSIACFSKSTLPLALAAASVNAEGMLLLLRYGADPGMAGSDHLTLTDEPTGETAISILISSLNCLAFVKRRCHTGEAHEILQSEVEKILLCLRYVLRAIRVLPVISSSSPQASTLWTGQSQALSNLTVLATFWPTLCDRGLVGVPSLQHHCRLLIRRQLDRTFHGTIPELITSLPLPGRMKSYINLQHD